MAKKEFNELPPTIRARMSGIIERLGSWPAISGAKPLRGNLANHYRIRTGDYRIQFVVNGDVVMVETVGHRDGFYD